MLRCSVSVKCIYNGFLSGSWIFLNSFELFWDNGVYIYCGVCVYVVRVLYIVLADCVRWG